MTGFRNVQVKIITMRNAHCKYAVHTDLYSTHRDQWLCSMQHRVGWGEMGIAGIAGHVGYSNEWPILPAMPISLHPTLYTCRIYR